MLFYNLIFQGVILSAMLGLPVALNSGRELVVHPEKSIQSLTFFVLNEKFWLKTLDIVGILIGMYVLTRILLAMIGKYRSIAIAETKAKKRDNKRIETVTSILRNTVISVVLVVTVFLLLGEIGVNIAPLVAGAGIAGITIGFGVQSLVKDLFYGFFILFENQFGIGDVIQVGGAMGKVERMTLRTITLRDQDQNVYIVPNGDASKVTVFTQNWSGMSIDLQVSSQAKVEEVSNLIDKVNQDFSAQYPKIMIEGPRNLGLDGFLPGKMVFKVIAKTQPHKQWELARLYRRAIKDAFDDAGIQLYPA